MSFFALGSPVFPRRRKKWDIWLHPKGFCRDFVKKALSGSFSTLKYPNRLPLVRFIWTNTSIDPFSHHQNIRFKKL